LTWTDGVLTAGPRGRNAKMIAFEQLDGDVRASCESPYVPIKDLTNPYAFLGGVEAMTLVFRYPEPRVVTEGELPSLGPGGVMPPR
jgi:hypothetical protein